eukprot:12504124-Alexandrium_andersonii.AAC.1
MRQAAKDMKAKRKKLAKELCNATKRRQRLRMRCKELRAEDLLEVLATQRIRDAQQAAASQSSSAETEPAPAHECAGACRRAAGPRSV